MQVQLKNNIFAATQWFKDGDHPAVKHCTIPEYTRDHYRIYRTVHDEFGYDGEETYNEINPGDWIVEMFDGIHLYSDEEYRELFAESCANEIAHIIDLL